MEMGYESHCRIWNTMSWTALNASVVKSILSVFIEMDPMSLGAHCMTGNIINFGIDTNAQCENNPCVHQPISNKPSLDQHKHNNNRKEMHRDWRSYKQPNGYKRKERGERTKMCRDHNIKFIHDKMIWNSTFIKFIENTHHKIWCRAMSSLLKMVFV